MALSPSAIVFSTSVERYSLSFFTIKYSFLPIYSDTSIVAVPLLTVASFTATWLDLKVLLATITFTPLVTPDTVIFAVAFFAAGAVLLEEVLVRVRLVVLPSSSFIETTMLSPALVISKSSFFPLTTR